MLVPGQALNFVLKNLVKSFMASILQAAEHLLEGLYHALPGFYNMLAIACLSDRPSGLLMLPPHSSF